MNVSPLRIGLCPTFVDGRASKLLRVDGTYLYEFGAAMRPVLSLPERETKRVELYFALTPVRRALEPFIYNSVFSASFRTIFGPAEKFLEKMNELIGGGPETDWDELVPALHISMLKTAFRTCEAVVSAELQTSALYYVSPKGGYDTGYLTDRGEALFPSDLALKVPSAIPDVSAATRCIAFELPTAAGFHLHRANEAVLRIYWDHVTNGAPRPQEQSMGVYLAALDKNDKGKNEVREHLRSIKNFHRNPLMHPDQVIESIDQAIDLMSAIRCSIGYMLREINIASLPAIVEPSRSMPGQ